MERNPPGGDQIDASNSQGFIYQPAGSVSQTFIISPDQVIPLAAQPPGPPTPFIGRQAELHQLTAWLTAITPDFMRNAGHPAGKMGLIYGPEGVGKSGLMRHWLADIRKREQPPLIAQISFDFRLLVGKQLTWGERIKPTYGLDWETLPTAPAAPLDAKATLAPYFPPNFCLDAQPWVTLAAQLAMQSARVRQALASREEWAVELRFDAPQPPADALTKLLECAAQEHRPIILVCEAVQRCADAWFDLLKRWEQEIRSKEWPVLLLLEYTYPQALTAPLIEGQSNARLDWFQRHCGAPTFRVEALHLVPLTRHELAEILLPPSQQYVTDLFLLSEGMPNLLHDLLAWWRDQGVAKEELSGYWQIDYLPTNTYLFKREQPLLELINQALARSAELATELGYELSAADLLDWLNFAVWEGDTFHDQAVALAIDWHGDRLNDFLEIVDEALCHSAQHPQGLLEEVEGSIELPYGDNQARYLTRYRFAPPLIAVLLRQRQAHHERLRYGQAYAQALEAIYAPHHERILQALAEIYQSLGLVDVAADYQQRWATLVYLAQEEAALTAFLLAAQGEEEQKVLLHRILSLFDDTYRRWHPGQLLPWLTAALSLSRRLRSQGIEAATLTRIGMVYAALGEQQQALAYYEQALPLHRLVGDRSGEAATLTSIGIVYAALGEQQQALAYYEQALPLRRLVSDRSGEAVTLTSIGMVYAALGEQQQALAYYEQALPLHRLVGNRSGEAATLTSIGIVYAALGEQQQALAYYEQALLLHRQVGNRHGEAATLTSIGIVYAALGEQQQALAYYEQALPLRRLVGDRSGEAATLTSIGIVYAALGEQQQALVYYEQALPLRRLVGDRSGEAVTLNRIGMVYAALGEQQQALAYYEQALPLHRLVGDRSGEAATLTSIGMVYAALGEQQQALAYYEQALPLRRQVGDRGGEAATLTNLGIVYAALGEQQQALAYYEQALPLRRLVSDRSGEAATLTRIGMVYAALGEQQQALAYYEQALPLRRLVGDCSGEAATLTRIGIVYAALGEQQQALAYYEQALPLRRQVGDRGGEAVTLTRIGMVYAALGEQQQALAYYEQALPLRREMGNRYGEAATLTSIGGVYAALGEKQQALAYYEQALLLHRQVGNRSGEADTLTSIGGVYAQLNQLQKALDILEQALALHHQLGDKNSEAGALHNIGFAYYTQGDQPKAVDYFLRSLSLIQQGGNRGDECIVANNLAKVYEDLGDLVQAETYFTVAVQAAEALKHPQLSNMRASLERVRRKRAEMK